MKRVTLLCVPRTALCLVVTFGIAAPAQQELQREQPPAVVSQPDANPTATDTGSLITFRRNVNLVLVPVVVRDGQGLSLIHI